jgi:hypothetical protein
MQEDEGAEEVLVKVVVGARNVVVSLFSLIMVVVVVGATIPSVQIQDPRWLSHEMVLAWL